MRNPSEVDVIFVHFGNLAPTIDAARHIAPFVRRVIIVSNDGSTCPPELANFTTWIIASRNLGFGEAVNLGAASATTAKVFILNTDLSMPGETVHACATALDAPGVGVVGPRLNHPDGTLQSGPGWDGTFLRSARTGIAKDTTECDWVTGAALMTRRSTLCSVRFDGTYFLGYEDYDYCVRVRESGERVVWLGSATAEHASGGVIGPVLWNYYASRNPIWYARNQLGTPVALSRTVRAMLLLVRVATTDALKRRRFDHTRMSIRGLRDSMKRKPSMKEGPWISEPPTL